jgi:RHS repeat-associated protein
VETNRNMHKPTDIAASNTVPPAGVPWSIRYAYTYGGHKFLKETELEEGDDETRLYLGGAEFVNGQPESYYHGEGRVALTDSVPRFQYKLTDHLGNTMVLFEDKDGDGIITTESNPAENEVLQRNFYYAFGLPMQGPWNHTPTDPDMPYLYNGKELEGELGLGWMDYGARRYDAAIGRWGGVDPLAHLYYGWSPYAYAANNPILFIDPDGRYIIISVKGRGDQADRRRAEILGQLNSLTNDVLTMDRDGNVRISVRASDGSTCGLPKCAGTELIRNLIEGVETADGSVNNFNVVIIEGTINGT